VFRFLADAASYQSENNDLMDGQGFEFYIRAVAETHKITGEKFVHRSIVTNNRTMKDLDVVWFYNLRGAIEKNFDQLNIDWN
jgi:hypothetical protein